MLEGTCPIPGLLSLTSGGRKNKRTELGDRRLALCHEKVGGTKALASPLAKMLGGRVPPGFCAHAIHY